MSGDPCFQAKVRNIRAFAWMLPAMVLIAAGSHVRAETPWTPETYADPMGFEARVAPVIPALAERTFGVKQMSSSWCPDTGLRVRTYALEGETVYSPYTGRAYEQGDTGYFGPKRRGPNGQITAFGGDPLKKDLPPATAHLLLHPEDTETHAFLRIPGNLNQQYHFAATNWARFYPLLKDRMSEDWHAAFRAAIADYTESRRPSDGDREHAPLSITHDLVGIPGELLGGPVKEGGTENHKTMWRTSGLLYAQWFGPEAEVSGYPAPEAERRITAMLRDYARLCLTTGNGEWDSSTYYPHSIRAFLNVYDASPDPRSRELARGMLDFYFATYGLKVFNGYFTGPQKRGHTHSGAMREMDRILWAYWPNATTAAPPTDADEGAFVPLHLATTGYRPNRVIGNITTKRIDLPFEAKMRRPTYHMRRTNAFHEYFYADEAYAMGSIAMTRWDNPTQQTIWTLNIRGDAGSLIFGGNQPYFRSAEGHSPHTQVLQKRSALIVLTAPTVERPDGELTTAQAQRYDHADAVLKRLPLDAPPGERWAQARDLAETWLFVPPGVGEPTEREGVLFFEAGEGYLAVRPITAADAAESGARFGWLDKAGALPEGGGDGPPAGYRVLVFPGEVSGYVLEAANGSDHPSFEAFQRVVLEKTAMDLSSHPLGPAVSYTSLHGDELTMRYRGDSLRPDGLVNGEPIDWTRWADDMIYQSPYLRIAEGRMWLSDGREAYTMDFREGQPRWRSAETDPASFIPGSE